MKLLSCAINAACLAMVDAGFPMRCLVCAVTCAVNEVGEVQLDPSLEQEKVCSNVFNVYLYNSRQTINWPITVAELSVSEMPRLKNCWVFHISSGSRGGCRTFKRGRGTTSAEGASFLGGVGTCSPESFESLSL